MAPAIRGSLKMAYSMDVGFLCSRMDPGMLVLSVSTLHSLMYNMYHYLSLAHVKVNQHFFGTGTRGTLCKANFRVSESSIVLTA